MRTLTDKERDMLLGYGVQSLRIQAGYIPKIAPENECGRVGFYIDTTSKYVTYYDNSKWSFLSNYPDEGVGEVRVVLIYAKLCIDCARALEWYYDSPTIEVLCDMSIEELCHACAAHKYGTLPDDIPF